MRVIAMLVTVGMLCGCGGKWYKAGAGRVDFDRDKYQCNLDANRMANQGSVYNPFTDVDTFKECMRLKGWELRKE